MTVWSYRALHRTTRSAPTGRCSGQRAACGCGLPITTVFISYAGLRQAPGPSDAPPPAHKEPTEPRSCSRRQSRARAPKEDDRCQTLWGMRVLENASSYGLLTVRPVRGTTGCFDAALVRRCQCWGAVCWLAREWFHVSAGEQRFRAGGLLQVQIGGGG